ncbi:NAD(P)/FAD-dependent oxidoreductase [Burkholderia cenocepacia]|uniref:NAD(P)/FAD-dependent oxidoreductase n=1 Tax=Burkholderia cenocepacia TaxID=95486 RepID=UPI002ABDFA13|nr:FAD-dependent oxidoreductase [Burkholderia cenocepacia]
MGTTVFERNAPPLDVIESALARSKNMPFWIDDIGPQSSRKPLEGEAKADLVIVGGGYLGLWSALMATERHPNLKVMLLEANRIGGAASGRNGGFCEASITHGHDNAANQWPEEADQLHRMGLENLTELEATLDRYGIDCDYERTGTLTVAVEPYQAEMMREHGGMSAEEVQAEVASPTYLSGIYSPNDGAILHPAKLASGLARVATQRHVCMHEKSHVRSVEPFGKKILVRTSDGHVIADHVILATNAFPSLLRRYRRHTIPVYDYVLMTQPLTEAQMTSVRWSRRQGISDVANQFHYYRLSKDNRILFGGYDAVYHFGGRIHPDLEERQSSFRKLASHFFTTFPQLAGLKFTHRWAGVIDTSSRFCAFFGEEYDGRVLHAAGFTGLGVGATRFAANVLLDKVFGLDTERTRLRMTREMPTPFPPEPIAYATVNLVRIALDRADHNEGRRGALLKLMDAFGVGFNS